MAENEKKLVIQSHRYSGETSVVSVRLPKDMLSDIDQAADRAGRTRSEIIFTCLEYALGNMEIK